MTVSSMARHEVLVHPEVLRMHQLPSSAAAAAAGVCVRPQRPPPLLSPGAGPPFGRGIVPLFGRGVVPEFHRSGGYDFEIPARLAIQHHHVAKGALLRVRSFSRWCWVSV